MQKETLIAGGGGADAGVGIFAGRRERLRRELRRRGLDAILVTQPANRYYLSGFELHDTQPNESSGCLVVCASGRDWLATDSRFQEAASKIWDSDAIFVYGAPVARDLAKLLRACGANIGFESSALPFIAARRLAGYGAPPLLPADGLIENLRMIKDDHELAALRESFSLNHRMLDWLGESVAAGRLHDLSEREIAWDIEKYFRQNGASELAFPTIAAVGANGAMPHAVPGGDRLAANTQLLIDVGCRVNDYCSDQTRTFWIGPGSSARFEKTLELVDRAQKAAFAVLRPGATGAQAHAAARKVFEDAGEAEHFTHGLGHGVGLQTHEAPSLSPRNQEPLREGMVVTVEPGLYYPGWGGVRQEHTVVVVEDGISIL